MKEVTNIGSLLIIFCITAINLQGQNTLLVPQEYTTIQSALDVAMEGDEVLVSPGTYNEVILWPKEINGIKLIGEGGSAQTIIDGGGDGPVLKIDNNFSSVDIDQATIIQGFTIQNGSTIDVFMSQNGQGMFVNKASPTIRDMVFRDNQVIGSSSAGVGLYVNGFNGLLEDCHFYNNYANSVGVGLGVRNHGTGLYLSANGDVEVVGCTFEDNYTDGGDWSYGAGFYFGGNGYDLVMRDCSFKNNTIVSRLNASGGGAYCKGDDLIVLVDSCEFFGNSVRDSTEQRTAMGGGIDFAEGGAVVTINKSIFTENICESGSAISVNGFSGTNVNELALFSTQVYRNNLLDGLIDPAPAINLGVKASYVELSNCVVSHNGGPGLQFEGWPTSVSKEIIFYNSTIAYNEQGIKHAKIDVLARNTILHNPGSEEFIEEFSGADESTFDIDYSIVQGGADGDFNIDEDPNFLSESLLIPGPGSPAIEAGTPIGSSDTDVLGNPRPFPIGTNPDIGAYEVDGFPSFVLARFYFDDNDDGVKQDDEFYTELGSIIVDDDKQLDNFSKEGIFVIPENDQLNIKFDNDFSENWTLTSDASFDFDFSGGALQDTIEFGIISVNQFSNLRTALYMENMRCGEWVDMVVTLINDGTLASDGFVKLNMDERITNIEFESIPDQENGNEFSWDYFALFPGEKQQYFLRFRAPLITESSQVGELYDFLSFVLDEEETSQYFLQAELRCAFDPNDKLVHPSRPDELALIASPLDYTIRFQNTGNDYAKNVKIIDTLDSSLDLQSFRLIGTSHPDVLQVIRDENEVIFQFDNIYLPDSTTNLEGSNGYVQFTISPMENVTLNTEVNNTAHIIFDFNPPIVTNTTKSILVDAFPVDAVTEKNTLTVDVFPNPTNGVVQFSERMNRIELYDAHGKWVGSFKNTSFINLAEYPESQYYLHLFKGEKTNAKLIIKSNIDE